MTTLWPLFFLFFACSAAASEIPAYHYVRLKSFGQTNEAYPTSKLCEAPNGYLYGVAWSPSPDLIRVKKDGTQYKVVFEGIPFIWVPGNASRVCEVYNGSDAKLYLASSAGLFSVNLDGTDFQAITSGHDIGGIGNPDLIQGPGGYLYASSEKLVYKIKPDGSGFQALKEFSSNNNVRVTSLAMICDGFFAGLLSGNETNETSSIFVVDAADASYQQRYFFPTNLQPAPPLLIRNENHVFGYARDKNDLVHVLYKVDLSNSSISILHRFTGKNFEESNPLTNGTFDGALPVGTLVLDNGTFLGVTRFGGAYGGGTVFQIGLDGSGYSVVKSFQGATEGSFPANSLLKTEDGELVGTTEKGGTAESGTIFKIHTGLGGFQTIHHFSNFGTDGAQPQGDLLLDPDGWLYGTTSRGGTHSFGTIFKINSTNRTYHLLHNFSYKGEDGGFPLCGLVKGTDGLLYGTTLLGGTNRFGTLFKISTTGKNYQIVHSFPSDAEDGSHPTTSLYIDTNGVIFGTTSRGGRNDAGVIYRLNQNGQDYRVLHQFEGPYFQGSERASRLVEGSDGALYGTTSWGGVRIQGTAYKINKDGSGFRTLQEFSYYWNESGINISYPGDGFTIGPSNLLYSGGESLFSINTDGDINIILTNRFGNHVASTITNQVMFGWAPQEFLSRQTLFRLDLKTLEYTELFEFGGSIWPNYPRRPIYAGNGDLFATVARTLRNQGDVFKLTITPPSVHFLSIEVSANTSRLLISGSPYEEITLQQSSTLAPNSWETSGLPMGLGEEGLAEVERPASTTATFYRVLSISTR